MRTRIIAIKTIAKRKIFEILINPGYYIAQSIGLIIAWFLISGFVKSIGSSGFNHELNPLYDFIVKTLIGTFGDTFTFKLFSEGPFLFALVISFLPVLFFLSISSVFKFGFEKNIGAIELVLYGPADGASYFIASLLKDILLNFLYLIILLIFFIISAVLNNLVIGPTFYFAFSLIFFFSISIFAYGIFISIITDNATASLTFFLVVIIFFVAIQIGSYTLISGYVQNLSSALTWLLNWISPVFYWSKALAAIDYGQILFFIVNTLLLLILSSVLLVLSHIILKLKGVSR